MKIIYALLQINLNTHIDFNICYGAIKLCSFGKRANSQIRHDVEFDALVTRPHTALHCGSTLIFAGINGLVISVFSHDLIFAIRKDQLFVQEIISHDFQQVCSTRTLHPHNKVVRS